MSGIYNVSSGPLFLLPTWPLALLLLSDHRCTVPLPTASFLFLRSWALYMRLYWRYRRFGREIFLPSGFLYSQPRFLGFSHFVATLVRPVGVG